MSTQKEKIKGKRSPGHFLKEWRKHRRLSQEQVAERIAAFLGKPSYGFSQVSKVETGKAMYTQETLEAFAFAFGVDVVDLFRPPSSEAENELSSFVQKLDAEKKRQALRILKAALQDEAAA